MRTLVGLGKWTSRSLDLGAKGLKIFLEALQPFAVGRAKHHVWRNIS